MSTAVHAHIQATTVHSPKRYLEVQIDALREQAVVEGSRSVGGYGGMVGGLEHVHTCIHISSSVNIAFKWLSVGCNHYILHGYGWTPYLMVEQAIRSCLVGSLGP